MSGSAVPQPLRVMVPVRGGIKVYTLMRRTIQLSRGRQQEVCYFAPDDRTGPAPGFVPVESPRGEIPQEGQVATAQGLVRELGVSPDSAARAVGRLVGRVQGLSLAETKTLVARIRSNITQ